MNLYLKPSIVCKADGSEIIEMQSLSEEHIDSLVETLSVVKELVLDDVLKVIRVSDDENNAISGLMEHFGLTEKQARYIVNIPINKTAVVFDQQGVDVFVEWLLKLKQLLHARPHEWNF